MEGGGTRNKYEELCPPASSSLWETDGLCIYLVFHRVWGSAVFRLANESLEIVSSFGVIWKFFSGCKSYPGIFKSLLK